MQIMQILCSSGLVWTSRPETTNKVAKLTAAYSLGWTSNPLQYQFMAWQLAFCKWIFEYIIKQAGAELGQAKFLLT